MKKVVFVLILVMLCGQGGTALATEKQSDPTSLGTDSKAVCTVIEDYLDAVNGSLSLSSTDVSFLDDFFAPQGKNVLDYEKAFLNIKIVHHRQQDADLRLLHYEIIPLYDKIDISSNKAQVELHISGTRIYAYDNVSRNITNENHIFEMVMTPQGWRIANHIGNETLEQDFQSYYIKNNKDIEKTKQEVLSEITADTKARKNAAKNEPAIVDTALIDTTDVSILAYSSSYDRKAFAQYGKDWCDGENPAYIVRGSVDCANFGSQCLRAGGAPDDKVAPTGTSYPEDFKWYYDGNTHYSWYAAQGLRYYLRNNNGSTTNIGVKAGTVSTISSVYEGDFAFNINPDTGKATHTIPIVGSYYSSNGIKVDLYIAQHSASPPYGLLSQVTLTGRTRELVRITGVYK